MMQLNTLVNKKRLAVSMLLIAMAALAWTRARAPRSGVTDDERELARRGWLDTTQRRP
jgi:hypothetical protein